jgi:hypothetical protein
MAADYPRFSRAGTMDNNKQKAHDRQMLESGRLLLLTLLAGQSSGLPYIFTRKPHLQPGEFSISNAKRLLQHGVIPGPSHDKAQGISSPGQYRPASCGHHKDGERQWCTTLDWMCR